MDQIQNKIPAEKNTSGAEVSKPAISTNNTDANKSPGELPAVYHPADIITDELRMIFKPSLRKTVRKIRIELEGDLTVTHIAEVNRQFSLAVPHFEYLDLHADRICAIDISAIQWLYRLKTCYSGTGKFITVQLSLEPKYRNFLNNAGLADIC